MSRFGNSYSLSDICESGNAGQKRAEDQASRPRATSLPFGCDRGPKPPCFETDKQWVDWQVLDNQCSGNTPFCADCLPEFAERMREEGRCVYPFIRFYWINGGWTGSLREPPDHQGVYEKPTEDGSQASFGDQEKQIAKDERTETIHPEDD